MSLYEIFVERNSKESYFWEYFERMPHGLLSCWELVGKKSLIATFTTKLYNHTSALASNSFPDSILSMYQNSWIKQKSRLNLKQLWYKGCNACILVFCCCRIQQFLIVFPRWFTTTHLPPSSHRFDQHMQHNSEWQQNTPFIPNGRKPVNLFVFAF